MEIFDYFENADKGHWADEIGKCDWAAAKLLKNFLDKNEFSEKLGQGKLLIMADGERLVSFLTLAERDCVDDNLMKPWIGFVFTVPDYRGKRFSEKLIDYACGIARNNGAQRVYIATDHVGLYEKFGCEFIGSRVDIYGEESRIYTRKL